ncbi:MAG: hypothetical protein AAGA96_10105 [Verrucomicrobiota bacterium]
MDQTDVAVTAGFVVGAPVGAVGLHSLTEWSRWIAFPVGGLAGFLLMTVIVFLGIELLGRRKNSSGDNADTNNSEQGVDPNA